MLNNNVAAFLLDDTGVFLVQKQGPEPIRYSNGALFKKKKIHSVHRHLSKKKQPLSFCYFSSGY